MSHVHHFPARVTTADGAPQFYFGADYNPEQWPREVWDEDISLMQRAGVNVVSLAIFSWARIQPTAEVWDFEWLDDIMDRLHAGGIRVDLATATASPPPWLTTAHPEILPVTRDGVVLSQGGRQHWRPTSPVFREHALALVEKIAERYANHPALVAWHINNELGCHNVYDYSDDAAEAFRVWLRDKYTDLDALNRAWGTAFWSQMYSDFNEIIPPRIAGTENNPTQLLDFNRFSSDALRDYLRDENDVLQRLSPEVPRTTNFMVMGGTRGMDYASWTGDVDFISNDHYLLPTRDAIEELAFSASRCGSLAQRNPWWLMEHSTSAVNWREINPPKRVGELSRDALTHVAHGADAVCYFQWRQSIAGSERFHAAMVPHAGADSRIFRDVSALGETLQNLAPIVGSELLPAKVAVIVDSESWWASSQPFLPSSSINHHTQALDWYTALLDTGVRVDVVGPEADLASYAVVVAPLLHVVPAALAARITDAVEAGTHFVTSFFSGIVDEDAHVIPGGYPGALRELLGVRVEEFHPLNSEQGVILDDDSSATLWFEAVDVAEGTEVLRRYDSGPTAGLPAITRAVRGKGSAVYVSTHPDREPLAALASDIVSAAGVSPDVELPSPGWVITTIRRGEDADYVFLIPRDPEGTVEVGELKGIIHGPTESTIGGTDVIVLRREHSA
ncbi:MAG: beta-galactosidase [Arachnia sp.]